MPQQRLKIFISAVTSEFGKDRDELATDLRARGHEVTIQSDFQQKPDSETLLGELVDYIRDCHAVICLVGDRSGAGPPPRATERLAGVIPDTIKEASYTQWEYLAALHFRRRPYVYIANDDYEPDRDVPKSDRADLQRRFHDYLKAENVPYTRFSNIDQLARAVLRDLPELGGKPDRPAPTAKPIMLPYPSIGYLFKGRDDFMRRLRESLTRTRGARTAIVSSALYGLGGIGKSRVAVEYAWAHADDYNALLFVVAETPEALRRNLAALSGTLVPKLDTTDDAAKLEAMLDWLKANPGWFLILDNVDTKETLAEVEKLLRDLIGGHVIVTSRLADFSGYFQPLELDVLAIDDAVAFLLDRTDDRRRAAADDEAKAREIAEELGQLALALEQAAAFIAKRRLTFAQYLEQWRSKRDEVLAWSDPTVTGYSRAVAVTWKTSVEQLTEGGRRLLERLAWLAPEKVPESLLDVSVPGAETENLRDAYDDLASYSLVTRDAERPFFLVHRLVQDVTRRSLPDEPQRRSLIEALGWVDAAFTGDLDDVRIWPKLDPLAPHARSVTKHADAARISEPTARLMNHFGSLLSEKALHAEAEPLIRRALAIGEQSLGPNHPSVAARLNNLAALLQTTGRLAEAEPLARRAMSIDEKKSGPNAPIIATRANNLAQLLRSAGRVEEAELLMRRALAISESSLGPNHPAVAINLNNLGILLRATNRPSEAEPLLRRALAIDERNFGSVHPKIATGLSSLAVLLISTNRQREAEPLMRRALSIDEKSLGPDHPNVAIRLNNLARLLQETSRLEEAEPLMRRHVAIFVEFTSRTGHRHPHLEAAFNNYAGLLDAMGKSQTEIDAACAELRRPLVDKPSS